MKILSIADVHGNHDVYHWLVSISKSVPFDVMILAGDLLNPLSGYDTIESAQLADAKETMAILSGLSKPIFYIMGNDDIVELPASGYQFQSLHERRIEFGGFNFVGYQYSLPFMGGIFEKTEEEIAQDIKSLEPYLDSQTILVTHTPAKGIMDIGILNRHAGSQSLTDLLGKKKIKAHIHGHIHSCFGRLGYHFNVSADSCNRAILLDIASMEHIVLCNSPQDFKYLEKKL